MLGVGRVGAWTLLYAFLGAPVAWIVHFHVVYLVDTLWCSMGWGEADLAVLLTSVPFVALSAGAGVVAWRKWTEEQGGEGLVEGMLDGEGRNAALLLMGIMGSVLFTLVIVLESLSPLFVATCPELGT